MRGSGQAEQDGHRILRQDQPQAFSHCHACGAGYDSDEWPRCCPVCGEMTWNSPKPVAVLLAGSSGREPNLIMIKRSLAPEGLALPGGYVESGEDWRQAALREFEEETGISASGGRSLQVEDVADHRVLSAPDGTVLIFGCLKRRVEILPDFQAAGEVAAVIVVDDVAVCADIVFPLHRQVAEDFLRTGSEG